MTKHLMKSSGSTRIFQCCLFFYYSSCGLKLVLSVEFRLLTVFLGGAESVSIYCFITWKLLGGFSNLKECPLSLDEVMVAIDDVNMVVTGFKDSTIDAISIENCVNYV